MTWRVEDWPAWAKVVGVLAAAVALRVGALLLRFTVEWLIGALLLR